MDRRRFLVAVGAATSALAGCAGGGNETQGPQIPDSPTDADGNSPSTPTPTPGLPDHAALTAIEAQPRLGPAPGMARGTIVAFEDPSCPRCRQFEQNTVPQIRSQLTRRGRATLSVRGYPVVSPWGEPASRALEAVYDQNTVAFWRLWAHYFDEQAAYREAGADAVYERTRSFLEGETSVSADQVITAAADGVYDEAVQTDLAAGEEAGAGQTTPHLFFFKDGEYLTKVSGSVSYKLVASTLGL